MGGTSDGKTAYSESKSSAGRGSECANVTSSDGTTSWDCNLILSKDPRSMAVVDMWAVWHVEFPQRRFVLELLWVLAQMMIC